MVVGPAAGGASCCRTCRRSRERVFAQAPTRYDALARWGCHVAGRTRSRAKEQIAEPLREITPTRHDVVLGDARDLSWIPSESVHLVCTSPPYAMLKEYPDRPGQLGNMSGYEEFLAELEKVWEECARILVPGGRIACVVGDVCIPRRKGGRHHVLPLSADIQVQARRVGLDNLTPIRWLKVANIALEASKSARYLGKPNLPNGIVKNDLEHILLLRKPGGYRSPTAKQEEDSRIATDDYVRWYAPVWSDVSGQLRRNHPAPYPVEIPRRLIRMFSFVGDTVVDPFAGTGTTAVAAMESERNSISVDIDPDYVRVIEDRLRDRPFGVDVFVRDANP
ncbi:MAG: site-specific DNA-methyltransferase [Dehalococcoidia bacterium]